MAEIVLEITPRWSIKQCQESSNINICKPVVLNFTLHTAQHSHSGGGPMKGRIGKKQIIIFSLSDSLLLRFFISVISHIVLMLFQHQAIIFQNHPT